MRSLIVACVLTGMAAPLRAAETQPLGPRAASSSLEILVDTSARRDGLPADGCQVAQQSMHRTPLTFWSTAGEARPRDGEGVQLVQTVTRCGTGVFPGEPAAGAVRAPALILETSATPFWDPGAMDPGPVPTAAIALVLTTRELSGFSPEGTPRYRELATDRRTIRLGAGEEFVVPIAASKDHGVGEVVVRLRAGQAGRPGAAQYGSIWIMGAAPRSKIVLDGGTAGRVGPDGTALLGAVGVGQHEARVRAPSGAKVTRMVAVVEGRTVVVSSDSSGDVSPARLSFVPTGKNSHGFEELGRIRDGAVMVRIPDGEFTMGNLDTEGKPLPHRVYVSAFLMDKLPITWGLFMRFAAATGRPLPPRPYWRIQDDFPAAFVPWDEARAYCEWTGGRLPTEAEREKAARGTDGRKFPWGNEEPTPDRAVFRREWGYAGNDTAGIRPAGASPHGLLDTGGNMWEWCEDWYAPDFYESSPRDNPMGPRTGRAHVVRGGSWDSRPTVLSASCRNWGYMGYREGDFGFRCAADVQPAR